MSQQNPHGIQRDSGAWLFFVKVCFAVAVTAMGIGVALLPVGFWAKGYVAMGALLLIASTFMLAKTLRDAHEADKIINRMNEARAERMLTTAYSADES